MATAQRARVLTPEDYRMELARRRFLDFLPYVKIMEPPPGRGVIPFEPWPHLVELAEAFERERLIQIVKAKQIGVSWLLAAHDLWTAAYKRGANVLQFSKGLQEAKDLLSKSRFIHQHLPPSLQGHLDDKVEELRFPQNDSRILALPSTKDAGVGQTATKVTMDEADFHEYLAENYDDAAKPTTDAGGQVIIASTVNPEKVNSHFQRWARRGGWKQPGESGFALFFYPYTVRAGRDEAWYQATLAASMEARKHSKNYPRTLEEALAPAKGLMYFNAESLEAMLDDCQEPVDMRQGGLVRVWRKPVVAGKYVAFGDCAWGEKGSYSCLVVADWQTGAQVAELYGRPSLDELALVAVGLCREYNDAYVGIEDNGEGAVVVEKMKALGYKRIYCRTPEHEEAKRRSWLTNATTRPIMLGELEEAVRNRGIVPRCREAIGEMMSFIRTEKGRPEAAQGAYADHVMAWAGVWQMRKHATWGGGRLQASGGLVKV